MAEGIIKTEVKASSVENAKKIGVIFQNIAENVTEKDLMVFYENIKKDRKYLARMISKLNSPLVRSFIK